MRLRIVLLVLPLLLVAPGLRAQGIAHALSQESRLGLGTQGNEGVFSRTPLFNQFKLPSHVRENPRGYSPLCRLELKIEDQLPVGMWVKLGEKPLTPSYFRTNAEVRFKLLKF